MTAGRARWGLLAATLLPAGSAALDAQEAPAPARLTLAEAARAALGSHPSVGAARAEEATAGAGTREARGALFPRLVAEGSVVRFEEPMIVAPLHGFDPASPPVFDQTLVQGSATLSYTLFDAGARGARLGAARHREEGAAEATTAAEQRLVEAVARAYLEVLTARGVLEAQARRLDALAAELGRVRRLAAEGRAADVERLRVEAELADARAARVSAASRAETAERALARLIGASPAETGAERLVAVRLAAGAEPSAALAHRRAELAARAAERSPEIAGARRAVLAAEAEARAARAVWFPELRLAGGPLIFGSGEGDFATEWQGGVALTWPLFTGGARSAAVARARASAEGAEEEARLSELETGEAIDRALSAAAAAASRADAYRAAAEHLSEVARIEKLSLEEGVGVQTDYLAAEADLALARAALVETRHEEIDARVTLARLTGELGPEWLAASFEEAE